MTVPCQGAEAPSAREGLCGANRVKSAEVPTNVKEVVARFDLQGNDLEFPVGIGTRKADTELKWAVDEGLQRLGQRHAVTDILTRYGVPVPSSQATADQPVKTTENRP